MNKLLLQSFTILLLVGCAATKKNKGLVIDLNGIFEQYAMEAYRLNPLSAFMIQQQKPSFIKELKH